MYERENHEKEKTKQEKKHENASLALLCGGVIMFYAILSLIGGLFTSEFPIELYTIFLLVNLLLLGFLILLVGYFTLYPKREEEEKKVIFFLTALLGVVFIILGIFGLITAFNSSIRPIPIIIFQFGFLASGIYLIYYGFKNYRHDWAAEFY